MYKDHLGNTFASIQEMADHWHIPDSTLSARLKKMTVQKALTLTTKELQGKNVKDHLGQEYTSVTAMCEAWGITTALYYGRIKCGYSVERALTEPIMEKPRNSKTIKDHLGNEFHSVSDLCKHWNIGRSTYNARRKNGWSVERALTTPCAKINSMKKQEWTDHLGNKFESLNAMCKAHGVTHHTFRTRIQHLGWSLEDALNPVLSINNNETTDPFGNTFPTSRDMYNYYNITESIYKYRTQKCKMSQIEALTRIPKNKKINEYLTIDHQIEYPYYAVFIDGKKDIWTFNQILTYYHQNVMMPIPKNKIKDPHLTVLECTTFPDYNVIFDGEKQIWDYWKIIRYRRDTNFGLSAK